ncbi:MAG: hypothetical protein REV36_03370 [Burkholderia sp.]|nr:hypothetical protein [Burkholderia sp.]
MRRKVCIAFDWYSTNQRIIIIQYLLIKESHITAAGGVKVLDATFALNSDLPIQIEVQILEKLDKALKSGVLVRISYI